MNSDLDRLETSIHNDTLVYACCTQTSVRIGFEAGGIDATAWITKRQAVELIAILTRIVNSKSPSEEKEKKITAILTDIQKEGQQ